MKQFNRIIIGVILVWLAAAGIIAVLINGAINKKPGKDYLVEINRIQDRLEGQKYYSEPDLSGCRFVVRVDYYPTGSKEGLLMEFKNNPDASGGLTEGEMEKLAQNVIFMNSPVLLEDFFAGKGSKIYGTEPVPSGCGYLIKPLMAEMVQLGFVRYAYRSGAASGRLIFLTEAVLLLLFIIAMGILFYIRRNIIKPFHEINDLPYELSKGHLTNGLQETKNRFFGKFIWGLDLLRESLEEHKRKELKLEKDKKLMLLSVSHDIKTPLSTIKLYARALYSDLYDSEEKRHSAAQVIEDKADQIESFVAEIIRTSSTDLFEFDVKQEDFYLSRLVNTVCQTYQDKLTLLRTEFVIGAYQDKMLSGDSDKLAEVFDNLLQNAIKYGDGRKITISFEEEDNCQLIKVTNTGTPLPSTDFIHMFESFWRGANAHGKQGNGLGLYICRQLLLKMGGDIFAQAGGDTMSLIVVIRKS